MLPRFATSIFLIAVCIAVGQARATDGGQREEFNAAYKAYQELAAKGEHDDALPFAQRAYELGRELYGSDGKNTGALAVNYGKLLLLTDKPKEAGPVLADAVRIYETVYGKDSPELIDPLMELGHASAELGNSAPQRRVYVRALELAKARDGTDSLLYGRLLLEAGAQIMQRTQTRDGLDYLVDARKIFEKHGNAAVEWKGTAEFYLGKHYLSIRRYRDAEKHFLEALTTFKDPERPEGHMELATHAFLVETYQLQKKHDMATSHCVAIGRMTPFKSTQDFQPLFRRSPEYPAGALAAGRQGWAQIEFTVDETGSVRDARTVDVEGGERFGEAALEAIKDWRYAPRFVDGKPVVTNQVQTIVKFEIAP